MCCDISEGAELIDDVFLRDVIMNYIIAGRDTTASALTWTLFSISTHPQVEQRVRMAVER